MIEIRKKRTIVISIIGLVLFLLAILSASYAYFTSNIDKKGTGGTDVGTAKLSAKFVDTENLIIKNMIPSDSFTKTFSLENNSTIAMQYKIVIKDLVNEFSSYEDITYVLTDDNGYRKTGTFPKTTQALSDVLTLDASTTRNYTLTITYQNTAVDQSPDMGKTISGKIFIEEI